MADFQPGEIVDIVIKGGRIDAIEKNWVHVVMPTGTTARVELTDHEGVRITRVAPAEWPPQPGDIWGDGADERYFVRDNNTLVPRGVGGNVQPNYLMQVLGPLSLVHREQQDGGAE